MDALIFTAGIGENAPSIRQRICKELDALGITIDENKNKSKKTSNNMAEISADNSPVKVLVIRCNEELEIAQQTMTCIS